MKTTITVGDGPQAVTVSIERDAPEEAPIYGHARRLMGRALGMGPADPAEP